MTVSDVLVMPNKKAFLEALRGDRETIQANPLIANMTTNEKIMMAIITERTDHLTDEELAVWDFWQNNKTDEAE